MVPQFSWAVGGLSSGRASSRTARSTPVGALASQRRQAREEEYAADELHGPIDHLGRERAQRARVTRAEAARGWWTFWDASGGRRRRLLSRREEVNPVAVRLNGCPSGTQAVRISRSSAARSSVAGCRRRSMDHARPFVAHHRDGANAPEVAFAAASHGGSGRRGIRTASGRRTGDYWDGLRQGPWVTGASTGASNPKASTATEPGRRWIRGVGWLEAQRGRLPRRPPAGPVDAVVAGNVKTSEGDFVDGKEDGVRTTTESAVQPTQVVSFSGRPIRAAVRESVSERTAARGKPRTQQARQGRGPSWFDTA